MAGLFLICDHDGHEHVKTDWQIRHKIMKESSKSNYNWLAPADELIRVCNCKGFNKRYAKDIKVAILKCYIDLLRNGVPTSICYAYQAMQELKDYSDNKKVQKIREIFARNYVSKAIF